MIYIILAAIIILTTAVATIIALVRLNTLAEEIKKIEEGSIYEDS